jgi:small subunit ribosomal protein S20
MANTASTLKRVRSNERKRVRNQKTRTKARSAVREAREALVAGNKETAVKATLAAVSEIDRAAQKGVVHKKNASRRKGRLMKQLAKIQATK